MRKHRLTALILCAAMALVPATSCQKNKKKSSSSQIKQSDMANIGVNEINVGLSEEANENDTVFKLNSVIDAGKQTDKEVTVGVVDGFEVVQVDHIDGVEALGSGAGKEIVDGIHGGTPVEQARHGVGGGGLH